MPPRSEHAALNFFYFFDLAVVFIRSMPVIGGTTKNF
jgi:hypothetical protein